MFTSSSCSLLLFLLCSKTTQLPPLMRYKMPGSAVLVYLSEMLILCEIYLIILLETNQEFYPLLSEVYKCKIRVSLIFTRTHNLA